MHSDAPIAAATDWDQILRLYDQLLIVAPSPVAALNRAVAVAELDGPAAALALADNLHLDRYYLFHVIRADLLRRLGRRAEADAAYDTAIARTGNAAERAHLALAKQQLSQPDGVAESERQERADRGPGIINADLGAELEHEERQGGAEDADRHCREEPG